MDTSDSFFLFIYSIAFGIGIGIFIVQTPTTSTTVKTQPSVIVENYYECMNEDVNTTILSWNGIKVRNGDVVVEAPTEVREYLSVFNGTIYLYSNMNVTNIGMINSSLVIGDPSLEDNKKELLDGPELILLHLNNTIEHTGIVRWLCPVGYGNGMYDDRYLYCTEVE